MEFKDLHSENDRTLTKKTEDNTNIWKIYLVHVLEELAFLNDHITQSNI